MKVKVLALFGAFLLSLGCHSPEMIAPPPVVGHPLRVTVKVTDVRSDRFEVEQRFAEALRDRLADRARVLPANAPEDPDELELVVKVVQSMARGDVVKDSAAKAFLVTTTTMGDGVLRGANKPEELVVGAVLVVAVGTVAAPVAATSAEIRGIYHNVRLGYKPNHLVCQVLVGRPTSKPFTECFRLGPWDVVKEMRPMTQAQMQDSKALTKEEAEALARVVCDRLESLGWRKPVGTH